MNFIVLLTAFLLGLISTAHAVPSCGGWTGFSENNRNDLRRSIDNTCINGYCCVNMETQFVLNYSEIHISCRGNGSNQELKDAMKAGVGRNGASCEVSYNYGNFRCKVGGFVDRAGRPDIKRQVGNIKISYNKNCMNV
ncbi:hypothetical protein AYI69_g7582 [Smittium culicis]|uniref:Uncharacterized protein n=1 Tax=Smittium culicis TaxID=133412 RepID=A0A1R1XR26_9FUNG|nr:hypothetical protein AYI69_g7582 [Smittium culicis]